MLRLVIQPLTGFLIVLMLASCGTTTVQRNPYLAYTEEYGIASQTQSSDTGAGGGTSTTATFRRALTVTFRNNHTTADANVSFVAWVDTSSIRSAEQQDVLLSSGFAQLTHSVSLGTAFTLPTGTFVYDGGGTAGATALLLGPAAAGTGTAEPTPTERTFSLPTPDAILAFVEPPVSCESIAFYFSRNGEPLTACKTMHPCRSGRCRH